MLVSHCRASQSVGCFDIILNHNDISMFSLCTSRAIVGFFIVLWYDSSSRMDFGRFDRFNPTGLVLLYLPIF